MLKSHPVGIGVGERAWHVIYPHFALSGTKTVMHAHNVFLQVAAELGIVGLTVFCLLIGMAIVRAFQKRNITAVAAVSGTLVMGLFDHLWYYPGMLIPFWSLLAFCMENGKKVMQSTRFVGILHEN